jgi:acyl-CoA thioesterase I
MIIFKLLLVMSLPQAHAGENSQSKQQTILIMGDSISAGFGIDKDDGWAALMALKLKSVNSQHQLVNASISGETTSGGAHRINSLLIQYEPHIVIIELGGNDGLRGSPIKVITQNLSRMILQSQQAGAEVILLGMRIPPNYGQRYSDLFAGQYQKIALEHKVIHLPFLLQGIAAVSGMMQADGIHPTRDAQPIMMNNIWDLVEPIL